MDELFEQIGDIIKFIWEVLMGTLVWLSLGVLGFLAFRFLSSPWDVIFGMPLYMVGAGLAINNIVNVVLSAYYEIKYGDKKPPHQVG